MSQKKIQTSIVDFFPRRSSQSEQMDDIDPTENMEVSFDEGDGDGDSPMLPSTSSQQEQMVGMNSNGRFFSQDLSKQSLLSSFIEILEKTIRDEHYATLFNDADNDILAQFESCLKSTRQFYLEKYVENGNFKWKKSDPVDARKFLDEKTDSEGKSVWHIKEDVGNLFDRLLLLYYSPESLFPKSQWCRKVLGKTAQDFPVNKISKRNVIYSSRDELVELTRAYDWLFKVKKEERGDSNSENFENLLQESWRKFNHCQLRWGEKDAKMDAYLRQYCPTEIYMQSIHECMSTFEKKDRNFPDFVVRIQEFFLQSSYGVKHKPHWFFRAANLVENFLNPKLTTLFCRKGLLDPHVSFEDGFKLYKILERNSTFVEDRFQQIYARDYQSEIRINEIIRLESSPKPKVEEVARDHYLQNGYEMVIHCENRIIKMLCGLLFWDIIYSTEYADAFRFYMQTSPLDLGYADFYERRKAIIDSRVNQIQALSEDALGQLLADSWEKNREKKSFFTTKQKNAKDTVESPHFIEDLKKIACCLTAPKVATICLLLLKNYENLKKGFPDLTVWNFATRKIKLVEVKSSTDQLSPNQKIWFNHLLDLGVDAEICKVKYS